MFVSVGVLFLKIKEPKLTKETQELEAQHPEWNLAETDASGHEVLPKPVKKSLGFLLASIALWFAGYNGVTTWFTTYVASVMGQGLGGASTCLLIATGGAIVSYIPSMAAQVVTPVLAGTLMRNISYKILFPYAAVFVSLSFVTMCFVRHGDGKAEAKTGLSAFEDID